ncbi:YbdD/YjiX family protein [Streptomyces sp. SBT349]|uniref:CstA-like transporter-associated (seleno)protein n=1 Tax=Streptomyces sp. SBT349 TaxID=1580539 RepID=UPI00066D0A7A|nr:YbdD/YjiX family protein [Streptomyces sp. SBT349]
MTRALIAAPRRAAAWLRWYITEFTGENAYDRYVAHTRRTDPEAPVLRRGDFERHRTDRRYGAPSDGLGSPYGGCC